jgi:hypothetical protein
VFGSGFGSRDFARESRGRRGFRDRAARWVPGQGALHRDSDRHRYRWKSSLHAKIALCSDVEGDDEWDVGLIE